MKEIWKLIELLNEYDPYIASDGGHKPNLWGYAYQWHSAVFPKELAESYIISARYGFVKWLVDNDKIDLENLQCVFSWNINKWKTLMEETDGYERYEWTEYEATESLIMLLSISNSPIEDLLLYLK